MISFMFITIKVQGNELMAEVRFLMVLLFFWGGILLNYDIYLCKREGFLVRTLLFVVLLNSANIYLYFLYAMREGGKIVLTIFMILALPPFLLFSFFGKTK